MGIQLRKKKRTIRWTSEEDLETQAKKNKIGEVEAHSVPSDSETCLRLSKTGTSKAREPTNKTAQWSELFFSGGILSSVSLSNGNI